MSSKSERLEILHMIENGAITAEEGARLLAALDHHPGGELLEKTDSWNDDQAFDDDGTQGAETPVDSIDQEEMQRWKRWWSVPLWIGLGIVVLSSLWTRNAWHSSALGFWFFCSLVPLLLGVLMMALAWNSRTAPWLHVRVNQAPGEKPERIAISFPIPLRVSAWGLRHFGHHIPNVDLAGLDQALLALNDSKIENTPLSIDIQDDEDGEHVQVFIG
ncbi:MAG: hypothetical protein ABFS03_10390 [Chloroflexota bacterium]